MQDTEILPKGTVIGHRPCVGCTSNQAIKITKSGVLACQVCGVCSTRTFWGDEPSAQMVAKYRASQKSIKAPPKAETAPPPPPETKQDEGHWYYDD